MSNSKHCDWRIQRWAWLLSESSLVSIYLPRVKISQGVAQEHAHWVVVDNLHDLFAD
jgi:hypothetical protein